jgi:site-specific DNA recombinase
MTRAAIYRRVSTSKQAGEDRFSLEDQLERCQQRCKEQGYEVVADLVEVHSAGYLDERPRMSELRQMIHNQEIGVVVLATLDRLARNQNHQEVVLYEAEKYSVKVELTEEQYEDSAVGRHLRSVMGFIAELEREKIKDRMTRGMRQRVRQGLMIPGRFPLYGYMWADAKKSRYVINPDTAPLAIRIWQEAASGKPLRVIAIDLTADGILTPSDEFRRQKNDPKDPPRGCAWNATSIWHILSHPAYYGEHSAFRWDNSVRRRDTDPISGEVSSHRVVKAREVGSGRVMLPDAAPALVSVELARAVQERLAFNKQAASRHIKHPEISLLRGGHIKCGVCGGNLRVSYSGRKKGQEDGERVQWPMYKCSRRDDITTEGKRLCSGVMIRLDKLDTMVWEDIVAALKDPKRLEQEMNKRLDHMGRQDAVDAMKKRIKNLELQEANIRKAIRLLGADETGMEGLLADLKTVVTQKQKAEEELEQVEKDWSQQEAARERMKSIVEWSRERETIGTAFTYEEKRAILYGWNIRVKVNPKGCSPRYEVTTGRNGEVLLSSGEEQAFTGTHSVTVARHRHVALPDSTFLAAWRQSR